ncbi:hypothetical protein GCM10023319_35250 [Nocardia iowensis]
MVPNRITVTRLPARNGRPDLWRVRVDYRDADGRRCRKSAIRRNQDDAIEAMIDWLENWGVAGAVVDRLLSELEIRE